MQHLIDKLLPMLQGQSIREVGYVRLIVDICTCYGFKILSHCMIIPEKLPKMND